MKKENIKSYSINQIMKMKGKTRKDAPPGPPLPKDFWKKAKVVYPEGPKKLISMRFDREIIDWFKEQGKGYQTHMNAVLRSYVEGHKNTLLGYTRFGRRQKSQMEARTPR